jgi:predicted transcriptional regulator
MSALTIQLPDSLHGKLREFAEAGGISVEQLVAAAAGEKLAAMLEGAEHLRREAALGSRADFERVLAKVPDAEPEGHDRLSPPNAA